MRTLFLSLFAVGLLLGRAGRSAAAEDDVKALLDKAIKAHGGEEKLSKIKATTMKAKGQLEIGGNSLDFTQEVCTLLPDKIKDAMALDIQGNKVKFVTLIVGEKGSIHVNGKALELDDKIKEELKQAGHYLRISRLVPLKGKEYTLSSLGEAKVDGKAAVGIKVSSKKCKDIDLYFDKKTGLLLKTERRGIDPQSGQEFTEERIIKEYQKVDGIAVPKKVLINRDGKKFMETEVTEMKYPDSIDESEFKEP